MNSDRHFDTDYYHRFYENAGTAILDGATATKEVAFVVAFCTYIGLRIERFTDVGAGTGWWATEFAKQYPECDAIETIDSSRSACELYGHRHGRVEKLAGRQSDLVVCRDVLRYVGDSGIDEAMRRLAKKCRGVLYIHAITSDDDIDEDASDMEGVFRTTWFYRDRLLDAGFIDCGMGLFVSKRFKEFAYFTLEVRLRK
ncbi:MAG: class I SAM-dependent methyltransferase [Gemmatimonadaceae bacterium]|nr:class I SAM-dependent methyltransferase [Gemmatimonadaceae bacterium]